MQICRKNKHMKGVSVFRDSLGLFRQAFSEWNKDNASLIAAAIAYYAAFSLAPLMIILMVISGLLVGPAGQTGRLQRSVSGFLGAEIAASLEGIIRTVGSSPPSYFATALAALFLFLGATGLFLQTRKGLQIIWGLKPAAGGAILNTLRSYLLSFVQLVLAGLIVLLSAALTAVITSTGRSLRVIPFHFTLLHMANFLVFFIAVCILFASTYKTLSDARLLWSDVLYGSAFTAALFSAGNIIIGTYLGAANIGSVYGAASSIFVVIFWVYYSAQIFFFGAELIKVYSKRCGSQKCV